MTTTQAVSIDSSVISNIWKLLVTVSANLAVCVHCTGAILDDDQIMCEECNREFLDSFLLKKFKKPVCEECKLVPSTCYVDDVSSNISNLLCSMWTVICSRLMMCIWWCNTKVVSMTVVFSLSGDNFKNAFNCIWPRLYTTLLFLVSL